MRACLSLALLTACLPLAAQESDRPSVELPLAPHAQALPDLEEPVLDVWLTKEGEVWVDRAQRSFAGAAPQPERVTLDGLSVHLVGAQRAYDENRRRENESGTETLPGGGEASRLNVRLRLDRSAPLEHLGLLMIVAAEQKYDRLWLAVERGGERGEGAVPAHLPVDRWSQPPRPRDVILLSVGLSIAADGSPRYRLGEATTDLEDVEKGLRALAEVAERDETTVLAGEIETNGAAPLGPCVTLLDLFAHLGFREDNQLAYEGQPRIPDAEERRRARLRSASPGRAVRLRTCMEFEEELEEIEEEAMEEPR